MLNRFALLLFMLITIPAFSQTEDDNRILNQFIVMLKPGQQVDELVKEFPALQVQKCLSKQMNIWLMQRDTTADAEKFLLTLKAGKTVKLAQFNHRVQSRSLVPDDPYFNNQWNMLNTGQGGGTVGADIDATDAWAINHNNTTANGDSVVIAIIDGGPNVGFDYEHQDLSFFVNTHEIPNNGIDDDSDGYVDDYNGWNAFTSTGDINMGNTDPHAMHVSGIAGAIGNNATGIAGTCWGARILRVVGASGEESQVVEAYDYVREMRRYYNSSGGTRGAFVVSSNSSFGVDQGRPVDYPIWCAMYDSMGYVGILSAAATANGSWNIDVTGDIPTGCPSKFLITVTNTTNQDQLYAVAGYGDTTIALGAPGEGIYSTEQSNSYGYMNGCSMASPHIAGTVGAMFAAACPQLLADYKLYPDSIALVVKQMLETGVTRLSDLYNETITGGTLNLYNAIKNLDEYNCSACNYSVSLTETQPQCSNSCNGSAQVSVQGPGIYNYTWSNNQTGVSVINNLCPGIYSVTVTDTTTGCQQIKNAYLYKPDSIDISSIHIIPVVGGDSGNIIVTAHAGNYPLEYSLNGINYQNASTLIVSNNGNYNVFVKNNIGCIVEESVSVSGVESLSAVNNWNLFPNPVNGLLNISFNLSGTTNMSFSITNILGQKLLSGEQTITAGISTISTDVSSLAAGTYFITLFAGNSTSTNKFVITR
jgi:hypothetical protein